VAAALIALSGCQREPTDRTSVEAKAAMLSSLAARFRVDPSAVQTGLFQQIIWPDDCMGIPQDRECSPGSFFGYRLEVAIDGQAYAYHALVDDPYAVMLAEGPEPQVGLPALAWQWSSDTACHSLTIAPDGLAALGLCGGPHEAHPLVEEAGRLEEWRYFMERFAPFEWSTPDRALSFYGPGTQTASLAWQRAVAAWAELQWAELQGAQGGVAFGRTLTANRPVSDQPGICHYLEVTEYGRAAVTRGACDGSSADATWYGWLDDGSWELVGEGFTTWSSIYDTELGVEFYTQGTNTVGEAEKARLVQVIDQVIARIAGAPAPTGAR
jgi:hypothetical protein